MWVLFCTLVVTYWSLVVLCTWTHAFHMPFIFRDTFGIIVSVKKVPWRKALHTLYLFCFHCDSRPRTVTVKASEKLYRNKEKYNCDSGFQCYIYFFWCCPFVLVSHFPVCTYWRSFAMTERKAVVLGYTLCFPLSLQPSTFLVDPSSLCPPGFNRCFTCWETRITCTCAF